MSNSVKDSFKRLVKIYVTYDETVWETLDKARRDLGLEVQPSDLEPTLRTQVLELLLIKFDFSHKRGRYAIEDTLVSVAKLLDCYDNQIFDAIQSYDIHSAQCLVLQKW